MLISPSTSRVDIFFNDERYTEFLFVSHVDHGPVQWSWAFARN
jgi:hypothetical protein